MLVTLSEENYRLLAATSGERALKVAQKVRPDLVLMDIQMPGMDGFETAHALKSEMSLSHIPILFLSALNDLNNIVRCFNSGGVDYISKPFKKEELLARVRTHLALKKLRTQLANDRDLMLHILNNIIPNDLIGELKMGNLPEPKLTDKAIVMFTDFVGFTRITKELGPNEALAQLNHIFSAFDEIVAHFGLERIKTVGDAYMAVGGINTNPEDLATKGVLVGLKMLEFADHYNNKMGVDRWKLRIGLHAGPVISGIIGHQRIAFDVWGDTVNVAARLESVGKPNHITLSSVIDKELKNAFVAEPRGMVHLHNWGEIPVIDVAMKQPFSDDRYSKLYADSDVEELLLSSERNSGFLQTLFNV